MGGDGEQCELCGDDCASGLTVINKRPRAEVLANHRVSSPADFARVRDIAGSMQVPQARPARRL